MDPVTAATTAALILALGAIVALIVRGRRMSADLTVARRRIASLEERLHAAEAAQEAAESISVEKEQLAAIGELAAMIAHEIRNPLTIIGNAVSTLRRRETTPQDRSTLFGILEEESGRMNRLMNDLLSYARPVSLELQPVELREVVERALSLVPSGGLVDVELIEEKPVGPVLGDPNLLRQVFENLITNASQAMSREGGLLSVRLQKTGDGVDVLVEDTGEGMDTSVRDRALLPFFTTRPSGTGLGLAIVARIVRAHGGKLELKSAAGKGTTVRVFLPGDTRTAAPTDDGPVNVNASHIRLRSEGKRAAKKAS
ncbi:MAG: ATP-binding protein [Polyangiaceae bacterium]